MIRRWRLPPGFDIVFPDFSLEGAAMNGFRPRQFSSAILGLVIAAGFSLAASAQDAPYVGPHPSAPMKNMESHIGNVTCHALDAKSAYRRCCRTKRSS